VAFGRFQRLEGSNAWVALGRFKCLGDFWKVPMLRWPMEGSNAWMANFHLFSFPAPQQILFKPSFFFH
jgi:hypothetical protein